jgi:hypothetical protein
MFAVLQVLTVILVVVALAPALAHAELSAAIQLSHAMDMTFWLPQAEIAMASP